MRIRISFLPFFARMVLFARLGIDNLSFYGFTFIVLHSLEQEDGILFVGIEFFARKDSALLGVGGLLFVRFLTLFLAFEFFFYFVVEFFIVLLPGLRVLALFSVLTFWGLRV